MGTGEGGGQNCLGGWEQEREGARTIWKDGNRRGQEPELPGGMGTGEGGGQNCLGEWEQVRVGARTVWGDGNR
jgi:hypothetical protein